MQPTDPPPSPVAATPFAPGSSEESLFVGLLTECQLPLRLYVRALMPGEHAQGDVIQQANTKIWEKRDDFQLGSNFKAWALAIARYEVLNYRKQQARDSRLRFSKDLETTVANDLVEMKDDLLQRHEALRECLKSLKPESRELLLQRYASRASLSELADRVGRSVGGMKVTLHRLRNFLADCIERRMVAEGGSE